MSLTTVAAPILPDDTLSRLPPSRPERFQRSDFIAAALVFFITLGVYVATLAPNVTLEDSGELITAAAKFGVGHPPGYPLWTMSGFLLSHLLPFGGLAWRINLLCALFGAASNAVLTLLACHSGRWLLQRWTDSENQAAVRSYVFYSGLLVGLVIGFSDVMWSQAVISAVHGTLNALFVNLTILFFYLWMIEPRKTHRLVLTVFIFSLGLTNHHTLVQVIPAFLLAAFLFQVVPLFRPTAVRAPMGIFFSVLFAVNLFSLSLLVYISWLSGDEQLQTISQSMAWLIFGFIAVVSFFYLREFRLQLFFLGAATAAVLFAYGFSLMGPDKPEVENFIRGDKGIPGDVGVSAAEVEKGLLRNTMTDSKVWAWGTFVEPGWLQGRVAAAKASAPPPNRPPPHRPVQPFYFLGLVALGSVALGLLYTSQLNRRLVMAVFVVGWIGLLPYSYERFASATHPPMNWGFAEERSGFYYEVSREQYPKSLPTLIKSTFGKLIGVVARDAQLDASIGLPDYWPRLWKTFYYYGDNLQQNFTVPLIFLTLAIFLYLRRCDWPQVNWFLFLFAAFFLLGFMLLIIAPAEAFDFERNLQYKVFHIQSHCIFVLLMGYGALALMTYLHELMPEVVARTGAIGFGLPAIFLSLLPLWSNFDGCSQAGHWFGYDYGAGMMRPLDRNAVYLGGSDAGRFVPTFMAFVESQQDNRWKREPDFDRRDVAVITQNALCDSFYCHYIRNQYDARFRPATWTPFEKWLGRDRAYPVEPVTCISEEELGACWDEYKARPEVAARLKSGGPIFRDGSNDVFDLNAIVAQKIFQKNKGRHTFYIEQSVPLDWSYPYLLPSGLIFKFNPTPLPALPPAAIEEDRRFWDVTSQKLLSNPRFHLDADATLAFSKLAFWHADLYRWRKLPAEQEHYLRLAVALCPQLQDAVNNLAHLLLDQKRFDEAIALIQQAQVDDPRNDTYAPVLDLLNRSKLYGRREDEIRAQLAKSPYDVELNLQLARLFQDEGKFPELNERLRTVAGLTNWSHDGMADIMQYYVDKVHNPDAAIAFLDARAKIDPTADKLVYSLAALNASVGRKDDAMKFLAQAAAVGGTNVMISANIDPRFAAFRADPRFQALLNPAPVTNQPSVAPPAKNLPATNRPRGTLTKPAAR